jgi:hypothetical protein
MSNHTTFKCYFCEAGPAPAEFCSQECAEDHYKWDARQSREKASA